MLFTYKIWLQKYEIKTIFPRNREEIYRGNVIGCTNLEFSIDIETGFCYILIIHKRWSCKVLVISNSLLRVTNYLNC